jgi:hypothetical protein
MHRRAPAPLHPKDALPSATNALKHGLTAEILIPSMEDQPEFDRLCDAFETEYQPVGPTEESLLENLAAAKWRLGRAHKFETGFFLKRSLDLEHESQDYREFPDNGRLALIVDLDSAGPDTLAKISRYEARLERSFYKALTELRRTISQREPVLAKQTQSDDQPPEPAPPPLATEPAPEPQPSENQHPKSNIQHPVSQHPTTNIQHPSSVTLNCYSRGRTATQPARRGHPARRRPVSTVGRLLLEARSHRSIRLV